MQWTSGLSRYLIHLIFEEWKKNDLVEWKADEQKVAESIHLILSEDLNKEKALEKEVSQMLDDLEKTHAGQFDRYKMYPLLKKKIAKKNGIIL